MEERNLVISINLDENKIASRLKEINKNIESFTKRLNDLKEAIDLSGLIKQIEEDEKIIADPNFYNDLANSQIVLKQVKKHKDIYEKFAEYRKEGLFDIKPFDRIPEKEMAFVLDDMRITIEKYGLKNDMNNPMSKFIAENFPMLWN